MIHHPALQDTSTTTAASAGGGALASALLAGGQSLDEAIELVAQFFLTHPRVQGFVAALTTYAPQDTGGWRRLGERAWVREWNAPGASVSIVPPPGAGPEAALSMPWISQFARTDVVAVIEPRLLPPEAEQDRRELEGVGVPSFVTTALRGQGWMFGSLSLISTEPGPWPDDDIGDMRLLSAALSARITLEQARRSLADSVTASARAREINEQLLASVGHELRTPLSSVLGHAEMLLEEAAHVPDDPLAAGVRRGGEVIVRSGEQLLELVDQLLDVGRALRADTEREDVGVAAAVDDVVHWHRTAALAADVTITSTVDSGCSVWGHSAGVRQVLSALVGHAVVNTRRGGSVEVSAEPLRGEVGERRLRIVVRDTGPGLDREQLAELFKPYGRLDGTALGGKALSMSLSRSLAERDSGTVGAESSTGTGSVFWVELPVRRTDSPDPRP